MEERAGDVECVVIDWSRVAVPTVFVPVPAGALGALSGTQAAERGAQ